MFNNNSLQKLMYLVSPALPVGAYAYSQGLEFAVDGGWLKTEADVSAWIAGVMENSLAELDMPVLVRVYNAWQQGDIEQVKYWNHFLRAGRETHELLLEDDQLGIALKRLLISLEIPHAGEVEKPAFATLFALAGMHWQVPIAQLLQGFAWAWLENQVAAATKLVPFGQTQAQKVILALQPNIAPACEKAFILKDDELGAGLPALAIASAKHERQYSRLFRS
ncbi:urease accessory protein UreF [Saccharophagus degradans]|uniref:Urease accessory protein UreF n=1 Tax=Saccharophagus degradans TaxID=86304 RepID=A0AAW7X8V0_9GAMM|nr:urease accessory protein UreF [Saccharophagus degradans]MDO6423292.1 urease accessory protein UreF [Saccharophagus degradans]MDO6606697.1 urease accessory protein UreF [Saccharophagus degradans]